MNYNCERCGDRLGWREHQGPTLCERCRLRAEVERLRAHLEQEHSSEDSYMALKAEVERQKYETKAARDRCFKLTADIERLRTELAEADAALNSVKEYWSAEVERLQRDLDDVNRAAGQMGAEVERLREALDKELSARQLAVELLMDDDVTRALQALEYPKESTRAALAKEEA